MTIAYIYAFMGVALVSLMSFVGVLSLSFKENTMRKYISLFISLAVGALLGDVFIHLIPEAFSESTNSLQVSILIITGIFIFFALEKFFHWHHHGEDTTDEHIHPVGKMMLFSDGIHNFMDGIIVATGFLISPPVGIATTLAVILHEIPQEIGDFAVLVHAGYSKSRALWLNFLSAVLAVVGVLFTLILGQVAEEIILILLPVAAGGFIYIAMADLIPELHKTKKTEQSLAQLMAITVGVAVMMLLSLLE